MSQTEAVPGAPSHERVRVEVLVNDHRVTFDQAGATGAQIKTAAIRAGVPIQADFVLSEVLEHGKQRIVPDDKEVHLKEGDEFWAIPGDDNS